MGSKSAGEQTTTQVQKIPPQFESALNSILGESLRLGGLSQPSLPSLRSGFGDTGYSGGAFDVVRQAMLGQGDAAAGGAVGAPEGGIDVVPELSQDTLSGLEMLRGGPDPQAEALLRQTAGGSFLGANPFTGMAGTGRVEDAITQAATRAVGDRFSQAGRGGSPAEGLTLGRTVARELAPFAFDAQQQALGRGFRGFEAERGRQMQALPSLLGLPQQQAQNLLSAGEILEQQQRQQALEPLTRLNLISDPIIRALGGAGGTTTTSQPLTRNVGAGALGGALSGAKLGSAVPGLGTGVGAALGGLLGVL